MTDEELKRIFDEGAERTRQRLEELRQEMREEREEWTKRTKSYFILPPEFLDERLVRIEQSLALLHRKVDDLQAAISKR